MTGTPPGVVAHHLNHVGQNVLTIASWVIGEAMKMGATIAMFVAIAYGFKGVLWVPLLVTYLIALKTYWIAMAWK